LQPANTWGWQEVLQNQMVYLLNVIAWQSTKDAARKIPINAPKPFIPEFMRSLQTEQQINKDIEAHDVDDIKSILAKKRV